MQAHKPHNRNFNGPLVDQEICLHEHSYATPFEAYNDVNMQLDMYMKNVALQTSASVVSISTWLGETNIQFACSGFIIECRLVNDKFHSLILTSRVIITGNSNDDNFKICVSLSNRKTYEGKIFASDLHYNLCLVKIEHESAVCEAVTEGCIDTPWTDSFSGEIVMALGRYYQMPYGFEVAAGLLCLGSCGFDCEELLRVGCRISMCGIGGPVINRRGFVLGMSYYASEFTPFLPINIALKWWSHLKQNMVFRPPRLGMEVLNFCTADIDVLEKAGLKFPDIFPDIFKGIIVKKIKKGSAADLAGIQPEDVIIECSGHTVISFFQFLGLVWDKIGERVDLSLIRPKTSYSLVKLSMFVDDPGDGKFNRWPLPKKEIIWRRVYAAIR